jgi:hypothetical protein
MKVIRCIKCGRPLRNPESITRGMGPECAGETGAHRRRNEARMHSRSGFSYAVLETGSSSSATLLSLIDMDEPQTDHLTVVNASYGNSSFSEIQMKYPTDLLALVFSAPGEITKQVKRFSKKRESHNFVSPSRTLQEIRRMCIDLRLTFFPGMSTLDGQPIACIPCGDEGWKFENSDKMMSREELESYLTRYGMIRRANK